MFVCVFGEGGELCECVRGRGGKYYAICMCTVFWKCEVCECVRGRGVNIMQFVCVQCFGNVRFTACIL